MPIIEAFTGFATSPFSKAIGSAIISYTAHYGMTKAYTTMCVPDGIYGFLQGLVTSGSPVCQATVQIISSTQISYSQMIMIGISRVILDYVAPGVSTK
jgi:hypothetical protein